MVKTEVVNRMKDSWEVNMILPESFAPTIDSNVSMKNWGDGVCRPLIYAGDVSQDVLETNSPYPEVVNIQNTEEAIDTDRAATRNKRWLDMEDNSDTDYSIKHGMTHAHDNSATHEDIPTWT